LTDINTNYCQEKGRKKSVMPRLQKIVQTSKIPLSLMVWNIFSLFATVKRWSSSFVCYFVCLFVYNLSVCLFLGIFLPGLFVCMQLNSTSNHIKRFDGSSIFKPLHLRYVSCFHITLSPTHSQWIGSSLITPFSSKTKYCIPKTNRLEAEDAWKADKTWRIRFSSHITVSSHCRLTIYYTNPFKDKILYPENQPTENRRCMKSRQSFCPRI